MKNLLKIFVTVAVAVLCSRSADAQAMRAVTSNPGPNLHVVATWPPSDTVQRYNIYRKPAAAASFPATPLNAASIQRLTSCAAIKAVIPPVSEEWTLLAKGLADSPTVDFDPCAIGAIAPGSPKEAKLYFLARSRWRIAVAVGVAFDDTTVTNGTAYVYELHGVNTVGNETGTLFTNVGVTAGAPVTIPAPSGLTATAGDTRVLLLWGDQPTAAGFAVLRATIAAGPYTRVNDSTFTTRIRQDLDGKPLATPSNGYLDAERFDSSGHPMTHTVLGTAIAGPSDAVTYFYKVASVDLLDRMGPPSAAAVSATPLDKTSPAAPTGISVKAVDTENRLEVRWNIVEFDIDGHIESSAITAYKLFRYDAENAPLASGVQIGGVVAPPPPGTTYAVASDTWAGLRPPFGEKTYWYRAEATDAAGNTSARSMAAGGHLKDITAPAPPKGLTAEGFDDFIRLRWNANSEPDLDGYQIYRSLCHNGVSNPCNAEQTGAADITGAFEGVSAVVGDRKTPCTGEYVLVGTVSRADAEAMGATVQFDDRSIPKGSPLCYSYWIKAVDKSGNQSGKWPSPDPATEKTVCQRLRDKTPPDPAIISGLFARDQSIRVEWIGPPVQDIRAYHVYRADAEAGPYKWVGGMTVELPPAVPIILTAPYTPPPVVGCDKIPIVTIDAMSMGFFVDHHVNPKSIYWYKVVGIDQSGNEAPINKAVPVSTFTFTSRAAPTPAITAITGTTSSPFVLVVQWTPAFDSNVQRGFAVFRSDRFDGLYRQVGTLLIASEYRDDQVVRGVTYWYKVVAMDTTGQVSLPSSPQSGVLP
jgi:hypothetical protein